MERPEFVYTTYIDATPERVWQGLTDPAFTSRYWNITFDTDWRPGSEMVWHHHGVTITDPEQVVLESDPYRRLSYRWHSFTWDWAESLGRDAGIVPKLQGERRSKVTFELEPVGDKVKLTVVHDDFDPGSKVLELVSGGWPQALSALKTTLETDAVLAAVANSA